MITQHNQRIFYSDNGVLTDISLRLNDFKKGSFDMSGYVPGDDYIYIGSDLPFSNKFFCLETPNTNTTKATVEIWDGTQWENAVDLLDDSDELYSGKSLSTSGVISWKTEIDKTCWNKEGESEDIPELSTTKIYCFYWLRVSWDSAFSSGTTISHIGYNFNSDDDLYTYYPDLNNQDFRDCFVPTLSPGTKTDWKDQRLAAAANLCEYLRSKQIIYSPAQLLDYEIFKQAGVHETARIIYGGLDTAAYAEDYKRAGERFGRAINMKRFNVDKNQSGNLEQCERISNTNFMSR